MTALRAGIPVSGATRAGMGVEDGPAEMPSWHRALTEADTHPPFQHLSQKTCLVCSAIEASEWTNQRTLGVQRQERLHLVESTRNAFILHRRDLAEPWKARKDFPRQKWARKRLPGKWRRGWKAQRVTWIAGSQGPGPGWWYLELGGQGGVTCLLHPVFPTQPSDSRSATWNVIPLKLFCLCSSHTVSAWESFAFFAPGAFLLILQNSAPIAAFLSLAWSVWMLWSCLWDPTLGSWQYCSPPSGSLF